MKPKLVATAAGLAIAFGSWPVWAQGPASSAAQTQTVQQTQRPSTLSAGILQNPYAAPTLPTTGHPTVFKQYDNTRALQGHQAQAQSIQSLQNRRGALIQGHIAVAQGNVAGVFSLQNQQFSANLGQLSNVNTQLNDLRQQQQQQRQLAAGAPIPLGPSTGRPRPAAGAATARTSPLGSPFATAPLATTGLESETTLLLREILKELRLQREKAAEAATEPVTLPEETAPSMQKPEEPTTSPETQSQE
jgi:hypothetical protein